MAENKYLVYIHTSPSNKKYVGITCLSTDRRWNSGNGYKSSPHFWSAIQKYGWDSFSHKVVVKNLTLAEATSFEIMLIKFYKTTNSEFGYNCSTGGECGKAGCVLSDETRAKLSAVAVGRKHTDETRAKISKAGIGRTHTDKARTKMSKPKSAGHCANNGKAHSKPVIQYLSSVEIARFPSVKAAAESTNANVDSISRCCLGKLKTSGGYSWSFTQRDTSIQKNEVGLPVWQNQ